MRSGDEHRPRQLATTKPSWRNRYRPLSRATLDLSDHVHARKGRASHRLCNDTGRTATERLEHPAPRLASSAAGRIAECSIAPGWRRAGRSTYLEWRLIRSAAGGTTRRRRAMARRYSGSPVRDLSRPSIHGAVANRRPSRASASVRKRTSYGGAKATGAENIANRDRKAPYLRPSSAMSIDAAIITASAMRPLREWSSVTASATIVSAGKRRPPIAKPGRNRVSKRETTAFGPTGSVGSGSAA